MAFVGVPTVGKLTPWTVASPPPALCSRCRSAAAAERSCGSRRSIPVVRLAEHLPGTKTAGPTIEHTIVAESKLFRTVRTVDFLQQRQDEPIIQRPASTLRASAAPATLAIAAPASGEAVHRSTATASRAPWSGGTDSCGRAKRRHSSFRDEATAEASIPPALPGGVLGEKGGASAAARRLPGVRIRGRERGMLRQRSTETRLRATSRQGSRVPGGSGGSSGVEGSVGGVVRGDGGAGGTSSRTGGDKLHRYDCDEENIFRRRIAKMPPGAWKAVLRNLDRVEAAAASISAETRTKTDAGVPNLGVGGGGLAESGRMVTLPMYSSCIQFMARARRGREACLILDRVRAAGLEPDLQCINFAITACGRSGLWEQALLILRGSGYGENDDAAHRDVYCWSSAVDACGRAGKWREAVDLVEEMQTDKIGIAPNVVTYNAAISACRRGKQWDRAVAILRGMPKRGVAPNVSSFSAAISALGDAGRWREAISLFREMPDVGIAPDVMSFTATISACAGAKKHPSQRGTHARGSGSSGGFRGSGRAQGNSFGGRTATPNAQMSESASAARTDCTTKDAWTEAVNLLREMPSAGLTPNLFHFNATLSACAASGRWKEALSLLREIERSASLSPDIVTYSAAISACGNGLQFRQAVALLREMPKRNVTPNAFHYNAAISACAKCGRDDCASALLLEMSDVGVTPDAFSFSSAITACRNGNNFERASELKKEMEERGIKGGSKWVAELLSEVP